MTRAASRDRLDKLITDRGLLKSRERARALIMAGRVTVDGVPVLKPGSMIRHESAIAIAEDPLPFVGRGGLKLDAALGHFAIDPSGMIAMDIGCSTGGFTDCLLQRGAARVYAIDVGYGQLDWSLRKDPRVVLLEKTNIRHLEPEAIPERIDLVVIDVSFISLTLVLPRAFSFLRQTGEVLALVKPQFEVGREQVGKGGIVRDEAIRLSAVEKVSVGARETGFVVFGSFLSPLPGQKGNREYFIHLRRP